MLTEGLRPLTIIMGVTAPRKLEHYRFMIKPGGYISYIDIAIQAEWYDAGPDIHGHIIEPSYELVKLIYSFVSRLDIPFQWLLGELPVVKPILKPRWSFEEVILKKQVRQRNLMREVMMAAATKSIYYVNTKQAMYCVRFVRLLSSRKHQMVVNIIVINNTTLKYKEIKYKRKTGKSKKLKRTKKTRKTIPIGPTILRKTRNVNQYHYLSKLLEYRRNNYNIFGNPRLTRISDVGKAYQLLKYTFFNHYNE